MERGILADVSVERFQIVEALRLGDLQHFLFDLGDAFKAHFVDLVGTEVGCGLVAHGEAVARLPVGESPDSGINAAVRSIVLADELGESGIRGCDCVLDRLFNGCLEARAVGLRN